METKTKKPIIFCFSLFFLLLIRAQAQQPNSFPTPLTPEDRPINLYLLDIPTNFDDGYQWPSYTQAIYNTAAVHQVVNKTLGNLIEPVHPFWGKVLTTGGILAFNVAYAYLPGGTAWEHQEAHRAILHRRGISSYNQANEFRFFEMRIGTLRVSDEELANFKRDYPAEFIRNRGAGHEAQLETIEHLKKDAFFYGTPGYRDIVPNLLNTYIVINYMREYKKDDYDQKIDERNREEIDPNDRDINGVEFTAWVYDLFRPDEPYHLRGNNGGEHPYGPGVDRYIGNEDLRPEEKDYLEKQGRLVWLNVISPATFGFARFRAISPFNSQPFHWNVGLVHNVVSFGHVVDYNVFLQQNKWNLFLTYHNYKNQSKRFPGVDIEVHRYPLKNIFVSAALGLWRQPKDQLFRSEGGTMGSIFRLGLASRLSDRLEYFAEGDYKTDGWVSGHVSLEAMGQFRLGINWLY